MNSLLGTLFLPFCGRDHVFPEWEDMIRKIYLPKDRFKVVLCDCSGDSPSGLKAEEVVKSLGYARYSIKRFEQIPLTRTRNNWANRAGFGYQVGKTYEYGLSEVEGPIFLCIEDDIIAPPNTFSHLVYDLLTIENAGFVGACTYLKRQYAYEIICQDESWKTITDSFDKNGLFKCLASAFGCFATFTSLIKNYSLSDSCIDRVGTLDYGFCHYIREYFNLDIYLNYDIKTQHSFMFRKEKCFAGVLSDVPFKEFPKEVYNYETISTKKRTPDAPVFIISSLGVYNKSLIQNAISTVPYINIVSDKYGMIEIIKRRYIEDMELMMTTSKGIDLLSFELPIELLRKSIELYFKDPNYVVWGINFIEWDVRFISRLQQIFPEATFIYCVDSYNSVLQDPSLTPSNRNSKIDNYFHFLDYLKTLPINIHNIVINFENQNTDINTIYNIIETELLIDSGSIKR